MYWGVYARKSLLWIAYSNYLPQNLSSATFLLGVGLGVLCVLLFVLGILLVTRVKHCIVLCPVRFSSYESSLPLLHSFLSSVFTHLESWLWPLVVSPSLTKVYGAQAVEDYCLQQDWDYWEGFKLHEFITAMDRTYKELNSQLLCTDICPCAPRKHVANFS